MADSNNEMKPAHDKGVLVSYLKEIILKNKPGELIDLGFYDIFEKAGLEDKASILVQINRDEFKKQLQKKGIKIEEFVSDVLNGLPDLFLIKLKKHFK
jgi:hypothetical protein